MSVVGWGDARFSAAAAGLALWFAVAGMAGACSDPKPAASPTTTSTADADTATTESDVASASDTQSLLDTTTADVQITCPGGPGCACAQNAECETGLCLDTQEGKACAQKCVASCPTGFTCIQVTGSGGDLVSICAPQFGHLCDPCTASSQCQSPGQQDPRCVSYGKIGGFCAIACATDDDCGDAYACKKVPTTEGSVAQQCVRKSATPDALGICPCSKRAVSLALTTSCLVEHKDGTGKVTGACTGVRACLSTGLDGLAACDAPDPSAELCDLKDNDCDGVTDEATCDDAKACTTDACAPGAPAAGADGCVHTPQLGVPCDDGDACTNGDACDATGCAPGKNLCDCTKSADCAAKEDGDACNGTLFCDLAQFPYKCAVESTSVVTCDSASDTACSVASCVKATGKCALLPKAASTSCDDGLPCTAGDNCQGGQCIGGKSVCGCLTNADCGAQEDGNLCNGTLYCDKATFPYLCKVNPTTPVVCNTGADGACVKTTCVPATGQCAPMPAPDGMACEADNNKCTVGDACVSGLCAVGTNLCDCKTNADCASKDDGDNCNGTLFCNKAKGKCEVNPVTVVTCKTVDNTACQTAQCDKKTGVCSQMPVPDQTPCNDGNLCTTGDSCENGQCTVSANTCLCAQDGDCASKDDGDVCNGTLYCNKATGNCAVNPATVVTCPSVDDTACMVNTCQKKTGACLPVATTATCDDGNSCTTGDVCNSGACQAGTNTCVCKQDTDCAAKEDGNLCNGTLFCNKALGACQVNPATLIQCPSGNDTLCLRNLCEPKAGTCAMTAVNQGNTCSDNDTCSKGEFCNMGACIGGFNVCPCTASVDCVAKDDGDWCNGVMVCDVGLTPAGCVFDPKSVVTCAADKDSACIKNQCATASGVCAMSAVPEGAPCDDDEACTVGDGCSGGACLAGKNTCPCLTSGDCDDKIGCTNDYCVKSKGCGHDVVNALCDDGEVCTADSCDAVLDCQHVPVQVPCSDGSVCTQSDACLKGKCVGSMPQFCSDGNVCTDDGCDKVKGCVNLPNAVTCTDNSVCTVGDGCVAGTCKPGATADCSDGDACTVDACDKVKGCGWTANVCDDKVGCTGDGCDSASGCTVLAQDASCTDGNGCTDDSCDKAKGCVFAANTATCTDSDVCTTGDGCAGKACVTTGQPDCNDKNACTTDSCDTVGGCKNVNVGNGGTCDDGSVCTTVDGCVDGGCVGGVPKVCGDGNPCSTGGCDAKTGCVQTAVPNGAPCSDGDACTVGDSCGSAKCLPGAVTKCDDSNGCTTDSCDKGKGCLYAANTGACSDGDACMTGDICAGGACKPGATVVVCDDGNKCTADSCDKVKGCIGTAVADGLDCGTSATCKAGVCAGAGKALTVGAGQFHTCALTTLGGVLCWGRNNNGQLGDGTTTDRYNPTPVALPDDASAIAVGWNHTCALLKTGAVYCWGLGASGQLGNNSTVSKGAPVAVAFLTSGVKAITAGSGHTCAITAAGAALCWGLNTNSQLGNGVKTNALVPIQVSVLDSTVTAISAGAAHTCAIAFDGLTLCWGYGASGALGNGGTANKTEPELVPGLAAPAQSLATGYFHTCGVKTDGTSWCWGAATLTNGYYKQLASTSTPAKHNSNVAMVSANQYNTCTLFSTGKVYCRGYDANGEIGLGKFDGADAGYGDTLVPLAGTAKFIATGLNHSCAVFTSGEVQCWGYNLYGQVGVGQPSYIATPKAVVGLPAAVKAAATGGNHTCATVEGGGVWCWGLNSSLQVAQPTGQAFSKPMLVGSVGGGSSVAKQISAGANHTCAVMTDGGVTCWGDNTKSQLSAPGQPVGPSGVNLGSPAATAAAGGTFSCSVVGGAVKCWGANDVYQLGNGTTTASVSPVAATGPSVGGKGVTTGANFACALGGGGDVGCWGAGTAGQTGDGTATNAKVSVGAVGLTSGVTAVVAGDSHACAVLATGALTCWGNNASGQIGNASNTTPVKTPTAVSGLGSGVLAVAAGVSHTCALLTGGSVECWGDNTSGQLGDLSTTAKNTPTQVFGLTSGAVAIAAGGATTCALMATGAIKCWGANTYGQIGNGDTVKKNVPALGPALPNVTAIAVGGNHTCAIADGGKVYCWGAGASYQMGDGTTTGTNVVPKVLGIGGTSAVAAGDAFSTALTLGSKLHWGASLMKASMCKMTTYTCGYNYSVAGAYDCWQPQNYATNPYTVATGVTAASAGAGFVCAQTLAGGAKCAGDDAYGQLGVYLKYTCSLATYYNHCFVYGACMDPVLGWTTPTGLSSGVQAISAGAFHACAVTTAGAAQCWGYNAQGQVGNNSIGNESLPTTITVLSANVKTIAAGGSHTCALLDTGAVKCWGYNASGQLGDGSTTNKSTPVAVPDLPSGAAALTAGSAHTCALLTTGAVKCWGDGVSGKLGTGTLANATKPVDVVGLPGEVSAVVAGSTASHTCAILKDGTLRCWGQNLYGQIGDGVPITSSPAYVVGFAP